MQLENQITFVILLSLIHKKCYTFFTVDKIKPANQVRSSDNEPEKIQESFNSKTTKKILAIIVSVSAIVALLILSFSLYICTTTKLSREDTTVLKPPTPVPTKLLTDSSLIAFVREGDVWLADIKGDNIRKITSHSAITYTFQNVSFGTLEKVDYSDDYARLPKVSPNGEYLAYVALSETSINGLAERELRIATGSSELFLDPVLNSAYELHIYDINNETEINLPTNTVDEYHDYFGDYQSLEWAQNINLLGFIKGYNLHLLNFETFQGGDRTPSLSGVRNFCGMNCDTAFGDERLFSISSNGRFISALSVKGYPPPAGERCFIGNEPQLVDTEDQDINKQSSILSGCVDFVGDWFRDSKSFLAADQPNFYRYDSQDWASRILLFEDEDKDHKIYNAPQLSPDNKFISYTLYPPDGYRYDAKTDLRIRNLSSLEYFDLLDVVNSKGTQGEKIRYPNWDRNSRYLYFQLIDEDNNNRLMRYDLENQEITTLITNAEQVSVN